MKSDRNQSIDQPIDQSNSHFAALYPLYQSINQSLISLNTANSIAELSEKGASIKQSINQLQSTYQSIIERERLSTDYDNQPDDSSLQPNSLFRQSTSQSTNQSINQSFEAQSLLHSQLIDSYPSRLREQLMIAKAKIGSNASNIRRELIQSTNQSINQSNNQSTNQLIDRRQQADRRQMASQFRSSIAHTSNLLSSSLDLSSSSLSALRSSTERVKSIDQQNTLYKSTLSVGSRVVTSQQQRHRTDRLIIAIGCCFFASVCLYILNKRMRMAKIASFMWSIIQSISQIFIPNWSTGNQPVTNEQTEHQFQVVD